MKKLPRVRQKVYEIYWYFASERQKIFEKRLAGGVAPWTSDAILQNYKFCNVFRAADRVSQYLIKEVAYHDERCTSEDRVFQIVAFRLFSNVKTWDFLKKFFGRSPIIDDLRNNQFAKALGEAKAAIGKLYTGAFILCANNAYGRQFKHENHAELLKHMFVRESSGNSLPNAKSLREIFEILHCYPLLGDFMSYQIAIDVNYSNLINFSEDSFTCPGPGALRGIRKVFEDPGDYSAQELVSWMVERQELEFDRLGLSFNGLWGRRLHAIDCQGLFCETDKYCRVAVPELASARKRIKAKFVASPDPLELFFPPKWKINEKMPKKDLRRKSANHPRFIDTLFAST